MAEPNAAFTRITIESSELGEVSVMVPRQELTLSEMFEDLVVPALTALGFFGAEKFVWPEEDDG